MNNENSTTNAECDITGSIENKSVQMLSNDITQKKVSGIYKIINKVNGKYYVGSSKDIHHRWIANHRKELMHQYHSNDHLQKAWNKYGRDSFELVIVDRIEVSSLKVVEQKYLDIAKSERDRCYNMNFLSDRVEMTMETRRKLSQSKVGKSFHTEEGKARQRLAISGKNNRWYGISRSGDKNPFWKGGVTHPHCLECGKQIYYGHTKCVTCFNKSLQINPPVDIINNMKYLYLTKGYKISREYAIQHGVTSSGRFYRLVKQ